MTGQEVAAYLKQVASAIETVARICGIEEPLFVLTVFNDPERGHMVTNCEAEGAVAAMRFMANQHEKKSRESKV